MIRTEKGRKSKPPRDKARKGGSKAAPADVAVSDVAVSDVAVSDVAVSDVAAGGAVEVGAAISGSADGVVGVRATPLTASLRHLLSLQGAAGGFEGEMVWNTMILSQHIIVLRMVGRLPDEATRARMVQHYRATRTAEGGWGMHAESPTYVYFTTLAYVALRILGVPADDPLCADARRWLHAQPGGVLHIPTWGKLWLSLCGLYGYDGVNPFPPEVFLLPRAVPLSPLNFYCHTRYVYLGIAYLYGRRFVGDLGSLLPSLRAELYTQPYDAIDFSAYRHQVAQSDLFVAPSPALRAAYDLLHKYEKRPLAPLRRLALENCFDRILAEQRNSRYQGISPVNSLLNCLAIFAHSPHHRELGPSLAGQAAWAWYDEQEGLRYAGARSQTWDTAFALQAVVSAVAAQDGDALNPSAPGDSPDRDACARAAAAAHRYLCSLQQQGELSAHELTVGQRDIIAGGWCFSDGQHRWPVSDCTAEAMVALLRAEELFPQAIEPHFTPQDCERAVRFLLSRQNPDGGFGTYERRRAGALLEGINPSEMYGSCMTERSYLECTASSLRGLAAARARHGQHFNTALSAAVNQAIDRGAACLWAAQRSDGSWPGFWGINFTYAIFHIVKAMRAIGVPASDPRLQRAADWLVQHQRADGGWGEHYSSCLTEQYVEHRESQVVMTSWALLALCEVATAIPRSSSQGAAIARGVAWLQSMQQPDGGFPQQAQNGVFFGTAMLDYRLYKSYFPVWALARAAAVAPPQPAAD